MEPLYTRPSLYSRARRKDLIVIVVTVVVMLVGAASLLWMNSRHNRSVLDHIGASTDCVELVHIYADAMRDGEYRRTGLAKARMFRLDC